MAPDAGAMNVPTACRTESRAGILSPMRSSTKITARTISAGVEDSQPYDGPSSIHPSLSAAPTASSGSQAFSPAAPESPNAPRMALMAEVISMSRV